MLTNSETGEMEYLDAGQIFPLVDSILPFEVCLHHRILPISLKDNTLYLGMVDPNDELAVNYAHQILAYLNCSVVSQQISAESHRSILTAYLYHSEKPNTEKTPLDDSVTPPAEPLASGEKSPPDSPKQPRAKQPPGGQNINQMLPKLDLRPEYLSSPIEQLAKLPPPKLLEELLARVLLEGIGRLYFERQESKGRILWSQNGILKSVIDNLEPSQFQWVINELKRLVKLPMLPISQPKQIEIERVYCNTHLLLRLRLVRGNYGEEANLQVLRGAALKFYQQQQLSKLSLDALRLAQQLQRKLNDLQGHCNSANLSSENLPLLYQLLKNVTHQVDMLIKNSDSSHTD
ncbi:MULTISPECIES: hypothetical protein [Arthrospira]|jgi:type II secretory ATPase GspE/PulE/Tfp pilus assembly ATPase PilB-like protein|uniref:Type II secretion system protein GspE N-terminal domain-containing protein n=1 Tax=Limnospira platensis NIES-46 TaxID=1236695 RepID=A0A5M3TEK7_LIMPL|nr:MULTISPECIES: hypothetical protein [Arthrospira]AMW29106.1 hypothetical protein AP285_15195 [Arthrospira platensis YZ]KDR55097.1 hypothetical protein APPUASWS_025160 [Arthrospira platensis str. Paraca]MBD2671496.1 hypothetical protein [Arthrospira platensis FACHB-439]MBD2712426.1 hypothetical protein [Arthrospira platensis FACHB-835]MDF2212954.1 hypothetical protein [Arthrospira platensis NCB002]MDT9184960.1 hypothetical protein [Limnospira sp. PMC 289.06]MDT9297182.1 hypothetical protein